MSAQSLEQVQLHGIRTLIARKRKMERANSNGDHEPPQKRLKMNGHNGGSSKQSKVAELKAQMAGLQRLIEAKQRQKKRSELVRKNFSQFSSRSKSAPSSPMNVVSNGIEKHVRGASSHSRMSPPATSSRVASAQCKFFAKGACTAGARCRFTHARPCGTCRKHLPTEKAARIQHIENCAERQIVEKEKSNSVNLVCGICDKKVLEADATKKFGILLNCSDSFCFSCLQAFRERPTSNAKEREMLRACPVCGKTSPLVMPMDRMVTDPQRKERFVKTYKSRLRQIPCRRFNEGRGQCPFGDACLFSHGDKKPTSAAPSQADLSWGKGNRAEKEAELACDRALLEDEEAAEGWAGDSGVASGREDVAPGRSRQGVGYESFMNALATRQDNETAYDRQMVMNTMRTNLGGSQQSQLAGETRFLPLVGQPNGPFNPNGTGFSLSDFRSGGVFDPDSGSQPVDSDPWSPEYMDLTEPDPQSDGPEIHMRLFNCGDYVMEDGFEEHTRGFGLRMLKRMGLKAKSR
eukprot:732621_1